MRADAPKIVQRGCSLALTRLFGGRPIHFHTDFNKIVENFNARFTFEERRTRRMVKELLYDKFTRDWKNLRSAALVSAFFSR
jgi:acyl carrier protein phosphodiesterase